MPSVAESYEQAIEYLFGRVNFERLSGTAYSADDFKLDRMREFLRRLGDPHETLPVVHIAGTKGKGSTAACIASVLQQAGYRTGLFTSPHISAFEERMAVDGVSPSQVQLARLVAAVAEVATSLDKMPGRMSPTYFEIATALAWLYFREQGAEIAVLEVGMGGRLDSTNLCRPLVSIITTISRDHTRQLGSRLEQIATEKAGIIKQHVPVVSGVTAPEAKAVIVETCLRQQAPLWQLGEEIGYRYLAPQPTRSSRCTVRTPRRETAELPLVLVGEHQAANASLAVAAIDRLVERGWHVPDDAIERGLGALRWPGRIEVLRREPTVIIDAAHNWAAVRALVQTLDESFPARCRVLVFAATRDKDVTGMLRQLLARFDTVILTSFQNNPRNVPVEELERLTRQLSERPVHVAGDPTSAWKLARRLAGAEDLICITGSFFIAAELRELIVDARGAALQAACDTTRTA